MRGEHCNHKKLSPVMKERHLRPSCVSRIPTLSPGPATHAVAAKLSSGLVLIRHRDRTMRTPVKPIGEGFSLELARSVGFAEKPCRTRQIGLPHGRLGGAGTRERLSDNCPAIDRSAAAGKGVAVSNADRRTPCIELRAGAPSLAGSALRGASPWRALGDGWLPGNLALRTDRDRHVCSLMWVTSLLPESKLKVTVSPFRQGVFE